MQIHLILALNGPDSVATLAGKIDQIYPGRSKKLGDDKPAWLVADNETARAVSEKLGLNAAEGGVSALVSTMADYFGRAEPELWSWIKVQWENQFDGASDTAKAA